MSETGANAAPPAAAETSGESFGRWLARERELRGISIEQIADQTRIGAAHLRALERDETRSLPARVFVLGYIRAYAHAIGINADEAALRYEEQAQKDQPPPEEALKRRGLRFKAIALAAGAALLAGAAAWWLLLRPG
jgi:cytoskeletal protein RodZ